MTPQPELTADRSAVIGRHHRIGIRRSQCRKEAQARQRRHQADRPHHPPPVPAAAVPGGDRHHLRGRDRPAHPGDPAQAAQRARCCSATSRTSTWRSSTCVSDLLGHTYETPLRHPDRRGGRRPVLLRQRPVRRVRAGHEVDRRRAGAARPHPGRLRAGRAVQRSGAAGEAADLRRRRRGPDRRRDGRADRGTGRLTPSRARSGTSTPPGRG